MPARAELRKKAGTFPRTCGVYTMYDAGGVEIYVGKAKSLRTRVQSYFRRGAGMDTKTMVLMEHAADIDYVETDSEVEALLLESRLIRALKPRFNIDLRWGNRYPQLMIIQADDFARILVTRDQQQMEMDPALVRYSGRFTAANELRIGLDVLQKIFQFRTCSLVLRAGDRKRRYARPCLLFHIKRCTGPCAARISPEAYAEDIERLCRFLEGGKAELLTRLRDDMQAASRERRYEDAARYRDELHLLERVAEDGGLLEGEVVEVPLITPDESLAALSAELKLEGPPRRIEGVDISHTGGSGRVGSIVTFINGAPWKEGYRRYRIKDVEAADDALMIREVIGRRFRRLQAQAEPLPDLLLVDGGPVQTAAAAAAAAEHGGTGVFIVGLAKKQELLYPAGRQRGIRLSRHSAGLRLLCYVRDEAHRFARVYHAILRKKALLD